MKTILYLSLFIIISLNIKCEDTEEDYLPAGIETRVFGNIYDSHHQLPIEGQTLIIAEYQRDFRFDGGVYDVRMQELDSITTDENGNFDFIFETGGMGTKYKIYPSYNPSIWTGYQGGPRDIENIGTEQQIDLSYIILNKCTLRINLDNVDSSPFNVNIFSNQNYDIPDINESNGIIEREVYLLSFEDENLYITRELNDGTNQTATFLVPASGTLQDRIFDITITNTDFE